jgi:hypothetical protein
MQVVAWSTQQIPTAVNLDFLDPEPLLSIQVAPQLSSRGWVDPVTDPLLPRKSGTAGNRTRDIWICSQELWPLDHRGGQCWLLVCDKYGFVMNVTVILNIIHCHEFFRRRCFENFIFFHRQIFSLHLGPSKKLMAFTEQRCPSIETSSIFLIVLAV